MRSFAIIIDSACTTRLQFCVLWSSAVDHTMNPRLDRKSTRLNSSHGYISYAVFCLKKFSTAMAIFGVGVMVGPTLGPTFGGYITDAFGWPWIFYINIPIGMLALALSLSFIKDSRFQQKAERIDYVGLLLLAVGIGTLQVMLERGERLDWFQSREVTMYGLISAVSLIAFVWHELTTQHP